MNANMDANMDANMGAKKGEIKAPQSNIRPLFYIRPHPIILLERATGYKTLVLCDSIYGIPESFIA